MLLAGVNLVWVTDIAEHLTGEGKLYCCGVEETFSYRVVGYSAAPHMSSGLVVIAFNTVVVRREINRHSVTGWVVHSDRGSQLRSCRYR
ncbi:DDE-type integrase/transposase/recombinase [Corynebacterium marambiense]|uniref:DDE-type integrase/transposase/recombinase n=1 Tax=Corynebacterium marambiense TaxID=2765364 RepID=UPI00396A25A2